MTQFLVFVKGFFPQLKGWFKEILLIGNELGLINLGNIFIDGTKVQANASKHKSDGLQKDEAIGGKN